MAKKFPPTIAMKNEIAFVVEFAEKVSKMKALVRKAFTRDYKLIPFAIYDDDFIVYIPEDCVLKKVKKKKQAKVRKRK